MANTPTIPRFSRLGFFEPTSEDWVPYLFPQRGGVLPDIWVHTQMAKWSSFSVVPPSFQKSPQVRQTRPVLKTPGSPLDPGLSNPEIKTPFSHPLNQIQTLWKNRLLSTPLFPCKPFTTFLSGTLLFTTLIFFSFSVRANFAPFSIGRWTAPNH